MEEWKNVIGYEGLYEVSNTGQVRSLDRYVKYSNGRIHLHKGKVLSPVKDKDGYLAVFLSCNGKQKTIRIHRLVAQVFIENPDNLPEVNHLDEDKTNNRVDNLEFCDHKYNVNYGHRIENAINTRVKNGYADPDFIGFGLNEKEYMKEYGRIYYEKNKDKFKEYRRIYYERNIEKSNEYNKRYYQEHKKELCEKNKERTKEWRENNREKYNEWQREYRLKKKNKQNIF